MADFDVFNGDADGIFALIQLRKSDARPDAELVTGVKRDIALLETIEKRVKPADRLTVLDISMERNQRSLRDILASGADVFYCDHHRTGEVPKHPRLQTLIDTSKTCCTSYLINRHLDGKHAVWAVCGAFGDNFPTLAESIRDEAGLDLPMDQLRELGRLVNYNAYGLDVSDLHLDPRDLFRELMSYPDPVAFLEAETESFKRLEDGYRHDWNLAHEAEHLDSSPAGDIFRLPARPGSNRISGEFGNSLSAGSPDRAFAVLTHSRGSDEDYRVSIRSPKDGSRGNAGQLASRFGGGGRAMAAGIDRLSHDDLDAFAASFRDMFAVD